MFLFVFCSCVKQKNNDIVFQSIDATYDDGWVHTYSIKIQEDSMIYVQHDRFREGSTFYVFALKEEDIENISGLVIDILENQKDTVYKCDCVDCGYYDLIINTKTKQYKYFVDGIENKDTPYSNCLIAYLREQYFGIKKRDSIFNFESKRIERVPLPPPPLKNITF